MPREPRRSDWEESVDAIVAAAPPPTPAQVDLVLRVGLLGEVRRATKSA